MRGDDTTAREMTKRVASGFLACAVATFLCVPTLAFADSMPDRADGAKPDTPLVVHADDDNAANDDGSSDAPATESYSFKVALQRMTPAPEQTEQFFIDDDGTALTWDEFMAKYYADDEEDDDADSWDSEGDDLDDYEDWIEVEGAEANLDENGWFLDVEEFRWFYCAEDGNDYAEGSIPAQYAAAAHADGLAFGKLHDPDFGGIWYYSSTGSCWHLIDAQGVDHPNPSPEMLSRMYAQYSDESMEGEDAEEDADADNDDADDDGIDDYDDADDDDYLWDESRWEDRIVGYGFAQGDRIEFRAIVQNDGDTDLSLDLEVVFNDARTEPAVYGYYPLDGSGTHSADTPAPISADDEDVDGNEDEYNIGKASDDDADEANGQNSPEGVAESSVDAFAPPVFSAVEGDGVVWLNEEESKGSSVTPRITIPAGKAASITYTTEVADGVEEILAASPDDEKHGYEHMAIGSEAQTAQPNDPDAAQSADDGEGTQPLGSQDTDDKPDYQLQDDENEHALADGSAVSHIPTKRSGMAMDYASEAMSSAGKAKGIGAKAWKRHHAKGVEQTKSKPSSVGGTATPKTGDSLPHPAGPIGIAVVSLAAMAISAAALRRQTNRR